MRTPRALRLVAALVSLVVGLAIAELVLRRTLTIEQLFDDLITYPTLASEGWRRSFVRDYAALRARGEVGEDLAGYVHDPLLGWDVPGRIRQDEPASPVLDEGKRRIVAIGDSFTYGSEVEAADSFPAQLQGLLPDDVVLNMGVRAYGVDQAALKYWLVADAYRPDVVVFAIFGPDYYRTPLTFYRFAKPRFVPSADGRQLALEGVPVPAPDEVARRADETLWPLWYGGALAREVLFTSRAWQDLTRHDALFYYVSDDLHEEIVRRTAELAARSGARLLVVYVPQAYEFAATSLQPSPERRHLERVFERAGVEHVDLVSALGARFPRAIIQRDFYFWHDDGPGHFTPQGNRAVAEVLADVLAGEAVTREPAPPRTRSASDADRDPARAR